MKNLHQRGHKIYSVHTIRHFLSVTLGMRIVAGMHACTHTHTHTHSNTQGWSSLIKQKDLKPSISTPIFLLVGVEQNW